MDRSPTNEPAARVQGLQQAAPRPGSAEEIVERHERIDVASHPFFTWLHQRPVDLTSLWILVANLHAGISRDFVIWLAQTIARVEDRRIASLLAKQLNDELGNAQFDQIHSHLLRRFLDGLDPWRPAGSEGALLLPGRRLGQRATELFNREDPYEAVGALIVGEIFAKKMDHCLGEEIRRQDAIAADALTWLVIHETLEVDHAEDSRALAKLVPDSEIVVSATWYGALAQWSQLWDFLDGVHSTASEGKSRRDAPSALT
jgi:pyrroloquinoline quinone (PQQ) biosynthesis protein C